MPTIHYEQYDFRKGRLGKNVRNRKDTKAYASSVRDCENAMVLMDGGIWRRWGTFVRQQLTEDTRLESWDFAAGETTRFILLFSDTKLKVFDMTLTERASFTGCGWTADAVRFLQIDYDRARLVITDQTFRTAFLDYDAATGDFALSDFAFSVTDDGTRLRAPFFQFASKTNVATLNIFTSAGQSTGYGALIATAGGFVPAEFNLALGTGKIVMSEDYFVAGHVGSRMRLLDGEIEILTVTDARNATVKVWSDVAVRLDPNPFFLREGSTLVEVSWFDHKLKVGDQVFFTGLQGGTDPADDLLHRAVVQAQSGTTAAAPPGGAAAYTVRRIVNADTFEIEGGGAASTQTGLFGGGSVAAYPFSGILGIREPVFSEVRGWPQSCCFHETRLWLGGSETLPDAIFGSQFSDATNFDTGVGNPTDAVQIFGVGQQARVRHIVSAFDLIILTDAAEIYIPGNTDTPITQETARGVTTTNHGAAFTVARRFDGGTVFVEAVGNHIREMSVESREQEYSSPPLTATIPEWVQDPDETAIFDGAPNEATPYLIFTNAGDGSGLVLHSSRGDDSFGFTRWTLKNGQFRSFAGVGTRLFAVAQRGEDFFLLEFDTQSESPITVDFATAFSVEEAATVFDAQPYDQGRTVQMQSGGRVFSDVEIAMDGSFTIPEPLTDFTIGDGMDFSIEFHPPITGSGQGPKSGKMQRLVKVAIDWNGTETGLVDGQSALLPEDNPLFDAPTPLDGWREYHVGKWDREPFFAVTADKPGQVRIRGLTQDGYF